ncbi:MAG: LysM peptidoglycan-binding domain-containing M23 family metallopeptidase [Proteobacteria bacterium]|nr:LysM peptidoglycan-binding domain-containing M23 family metallopeptidase [Pseudomonadota bacterium]
MRPRAFSGLSRAALIVAASALGAACSSDVARFDENPFRSQQVASAPQHREVASAPVHRVESAPLSSPVASAPLPAPSSGGSSPFGQGADPGMTTGTVTQRQPSFGSSSPNTPAVRQMAMSQTVGGGSGPVASGRGSWSAAGGTQIRAAQGDTAEGLSRRYGVPTAAIVQANGGNQSFAAGQPVVIPTYSLTAPAQQAAPVAQPQVASAPPSRGSSDLVRQPAAPAAATRAGWQAGAQPAATSQPARPAQQAARPTSHQVASGETMIGIARRYGLTRDQLARANNLQPTQSLRIGQTLRLPGAAPAATAQTRPLSVEPSAPATTATATAAPAQRREQAQRAVAQAQATPAGRRADPAPTAAIPPAQPALAAAQSEAAPAPAPAQAEAPAAAPATASSAEPQFRWPARGRVITGFRAGTNDGIKLSVPQGTPVKAAEDGVVAYAGNELRGYGNLVLVRHSNGYVTAYAHNSAINVRRGEQVRRGQTIAAAGQTGNVSSPQIHFEIRRGATPVDPMTLLGSN